jgi:hypothetical protein
MEQNADLTKNAEVMQRKILGNHQNSKDFRPVVDGSIFIREVRIEAPKDSDSGGDSN